MFNSPTMPHNAPTFTHLHFFQKGVLTPAEFVRACEELSFRCPSWQWCVCFDDVPPRVFVSIFVLLLKSRVNLYHPFDSLF
jgi:hypothetical protein